MAGYRDVNSAAQTIRRNVQGVDFSSENRDALEAVAVALAASGRVNEFAVMMQSLEKVNTNANLGEAINDLTQVIHTIKAKNTAQPVQTQEEIYLEFERNNPNCKVIRPK